MSIVRILASEMKDANGKPATGDSLVETDHFVRVHSVIGTAKQRVIIHDVSGKSWSFFTDDAAAIVNRLGA